MQQYIAQLLTDIFIIIIDQCIAQFVHFLYSVRPQALVRLFTVPRAFLTQLIQYIEQSSESLHLLLSRTHCFLFLWQK